MPTTSVGDDLRGRGGWQQAIAATHHSPFAVGGARWHNPQYEGPADTVYGGSIGARCSSALVCLTKP